MRGSVVTTPESRDTPLQDTNCTTGVTLLPTTTRKRKDDRMKITAAVLTSHDAPFEVRELEMGDPRPGEVLVRIVGAGMCHT
ncbi:MAG: hypothetical protein ACK55I_44870, partial [bacterium]